jgi:predicted enzyme related to lactoylglutathione lyase
MHRVHANGSEHWIAAQGGVQVEIKALTCADGSPTPDGAATREHGESGTSRAELSFQVDDVAAASARAVISGGRVLQRAETFSWGTFAVVLDPELNRIGLFTPPREQAQSPILEGEA